MDKSIEKVAFSIPIQPKMRRVAAYARVSSGKDAMLHSLSAQVSRYSEMIQASPVGFMRESTRMKPKQEQRKAGRAFRRSSKTAAPGR